MNHGSGTSRRSFRDLGQRRGEQEAAVARRLLEWANKHGLRIWWGQGKKDGSFFPMYDNRFGQNFLFSVWTYGNVELQFQHMRLPPFSDAEKRKELADRLSEIQGVSIPEAALEQETVVQAQCAYGLWFPGKVLGSLRLGADRDQEGRLAGTPINTCPIVLARPNSGAYRII